MERNDDAGLLRSIANNILKSYRTDPRFERVVLFAALEGHEAGLAHHHQLSIPIFELLRDYIVRRQRQGAFLGYNPGVIIEAIAGMTSHYAMMTQLFGYTPPSGLSDEKAIEAFTRIVMGGVQAPARRKKPKK